MIANPANVTEVFMKVINHLALFARDLDSPLYNGMNPYEADLVQSPDLNAEQLTQVPHPFICAKGVIRSNVNPMVDVSAMVRDVTECGLHTYGEGGDRCTMHPVVHDAGLAAWALGGPAACDSRKAMPGFSRHVYGAWVDLLGRFRQAISAHDYAIFHSSLMDNANRHTQNVGALAPMDPPVSDVHDMKMWTIKIRPGDPVRRRRKKR